MGDAMAYCRTRGGRLPTEDEWIVAAVSANNPPRRYPWGDTGAVCRRAAWGLDTGPCAHGADGPDTVGAHPDGDTALGIHDMAGNVAEWVSVDGVAPGTVVVQKGNWWQPGKHACRDAQGGHDRYYKGTETGFRCCAAAH